MKFKIQLLLFTVFNCQMVLSQNPIIGDIGISDPHVRVFNDTVYLFSGHDSSPEDKTWIMKDWRVFSTVDLVNWEYRATISPKDNYMGESSTDCWAGDAAFRNGKYYFYFSDQKRGIGVMVADLPSGPFKDGLGKPLISPMHDPTILIDDDPVKTPYIVYGDKEGGGYHISRLNDNMISLAEKPKPIVITGEEWSQAPVWMDKNYIFKQKDTYYLSWGPSYATSKNIYGPYESVGKVGEGFNLNAFAHSSFFWWKGQFYHAWCYYTRNPLFKYRSTIISYCHFDDSGNIVTDTGFLDKHFSNGVARYNADWPKIEAEWYYEISGKIEKQGNRENGFVLTNITNDDWICFSNVTFGKSFKNFRAKVSNSGKAGFIEIRTDNPDGKLIGKIELPTTKVTGGEIEISGKIEQVSGKKDIYIKFSKIKPNSVKFDWFKFDE